MRICLSLNITVLTVCSYKIILYVAFQSRRLIANDNEMTCLHYLLFELHSTRVKLDLKNRARLFAEFAWYFTMPFSLLKVQRNSTATFKLWDHA